MRLVQFEGDDAFEQMQAMMEEQHKEMVKRITEEQWKIADGKEQYCFALNAYPEVILLGMEGLIPIFSHVLSYEDDLEERKKELEKLAHATEEERDEAQAEMEWEFKARKERLERGYVFTNSYSVLCPEGELGDHSIALMYDIGKEAFEEARENEWKITEKTFEKLPPAVQVLILRGQS